MSNARPLTDVRVVDDLPIADDRRHLFLDFVSASAGATFDAARQVRYPPATLAPGTSAANPAATFTMTVRVRPSPLQESLDDAELFDPRTGQWASTGSLHRARFSHTATLLPDGKVLVVGGTYTEDQRPPVPVAEVYDPAAGVWSVVDLPGGCRAEPASCGRTNHTATLLADGTVLVAGGMAASAEPPREVTNSATIGMRGSNAVRHLGTDNAAPGVRLAVSASPPAGGPVQPGDEVSYAIAYFNSGPSSVTGVVDVGLPAAAEFVSATAGATPDTPDDAGRAALRFAPVVVAPGTTAESPAGSLSLRIKVRSEVPRTSTPDPDDTEPVADGTGLPLAFGIQWDGNTVGQGDGAHHIILARARPGPSVHLVATSDPPPSSRVVAGTRITYTFSAFNLGGAAARDVVVRDVLGPNFDFVAASPGASFDPGTRVVTFAPMDVAPSTTALAPAGSVSVTVVVRGATLPTRTAETYDHLATANPWTPAGSMAVARLSHSATLLDAEPCGAHCAKVLVAGGTTRFLLDPTADRPVFTSSMELYDPVTRSWASPAAGLLGQPRSGHTATRLADGTVLFAGSAMSFPVATRPDPLASSEIYDPASDSRRSTASMLEARGLHTASLLDRPTGACAANPPPPYCDGVLVVGGAIRGGDVLNPPPTRAAEIYRPSTPALAVSAIVPSVGPSAGGTVVRIRGSGLGRVTAVRFGDLPAASFRVDSPAQISAVTPPHPKGTVVVTVLGGADSSSPVEVARFGFVVSRPPGKITDLVAAAGPGPGIELRFSAPSADGPFPPAAQRYVVKQSLTPIVDEASFHAATSLCEGECRFSPRRVGEALSLAVTELAAGTTYHYAVRAINEIDQVGPVSDSVVATTPASPGMPLSATAAPAAAAGRIGTGATTPPPPKRPTRGAAAATTTVSVTGAPQLPTLPTVPIPADPPFDTPLPQAFAPVAEDAQGGMPRWAYVVLWVAALGGLATVGALGNRRYRGGK